MKASFRRKPVWVLAATVALLAAAVLASAPAGPFRKTDKAFYADERTVNFVRPGLSIQITKVEIGTDGTVKATFKLSDPRGLPLDREGITTPGTISTSFVISYIPQDALQYVAYTTRRQTSPITGQSAVQGSADSGGTYAKVGDGEYTYTFGTKLPADFDRKATHSVLIYASRSLTEFDLGTNYFDTVYTWVPDGSPVTKTRDVVRSATCNKCHTQLGFHGGARRSVEGCILCHNPQSSDPDTGNTIDLKVMAHKIHMGAELPSVQSGGHYCIIGFNQSENCYDEVEFIAGPNVCATCHDTSLQGAARPAQVDAHLTNPTRAACGACHDNVNFATGENHVNLPQTSDNLCKNCHIPQGEIEFDASIMGAHVTPRLSSSLPGTRFEIVSVDDGVAGKNPRVTFSIKDKNGVAIAPTEMTSLALVMAGPTTDYAQVWRQTINNASAQDVGGGRYAVNLTNAVPADARGSFAVGIEGYRNVTLLPGTTKEMTVRDAGDNRVSFFSVDGTPVVPRRMQVDREKCNACHYDLDLHGSNRNEIEQCVMCHNPNANDSARRPADKMPPESIHFATMIHRIHSGRQQTREFTIYGFGNTPNNFNNAGFPGNLATCSMCHVDNSNQLPLASGTLPVQDSRGYNPTPGPEAAACTACHATRSAAAHAAINTNAIGESCSTCHGPDAAFSVDRVHAQ